MKVNLQHDFIVGNIEVDKNKTNWVNELVFWLIAY